MHFQKVLKNRKLSLRGDVGIGVAPRLAVAHRAADTNAPSGHLNKTPGEGACVSHVTVCAVLGPSAPSKAPQLLVALLTLSVVVYTQKH